MRTATLGSLAIVLSLAWTSNVAMTVDSLRCEYLTNPLGIDATKPRLSWVLHSNERGQKQTAYHILVASSSEFLDRDNGDLWDRRPY